MRNCSHSLELRFCHVFFCWQLHFCTVFSKIVSRLSHWNSMSPMIFLIGAAFLRRLFKIVSLKRLSFDCVHDYFFDPFADPLAFALRIDPNSFSLLSRLFDSFAVDRSKLTRVAFTTPLPLPCAILESISCPTRISEFRSHLLNSPAEICLQSLLNLIL